MYLQKASPSRSMKSGNSVTSSTNSARSTMSPKMVPNVQTRAAAAPVPKARSVPTTTTAKSAVSSNQSSFDEDTGPVPEGLIRCGICKRNFAEDRIETHQVICKKNKTKKRKVYDASKKRVEVSSSFIYFVFQDFI